MGPSRNDSGAGRRGGACPFAVRRAEGATLVYGAAARERRPEARPPQHTASAGVLDVTRAPSVRPKTNVESEQEQGRARARDSAIVAPRPGAELAYLMSGCLDRVHAEMARRARSELGVRIDRQPDWIVLAKISEEVEAAAVADSALAFIDAQAEVLAGRVDGPSRAQASASATRSAAASVERRVVDRCLWEIASNLEERRRVTREIADVARSGVGRLR